MNCKLSIFMSILVVFLWVGMISAQEGQLPDEPLPEEQTEEQVEEQTEVVGIIIPANKVDDEEYLENIEEYPEDTTKDMEEAPEEIVIKEESHWLTKPFKELVGMEEETYKIASDSPQAKELLNLVGKRVKLTGNVQGEGESRVVYVEKYEVLLELFGKIQPAEGNVLPEEDQKLPKEDETFPKEDETFPKEDDEVAHDEEQQDKEYMAKGDLRFVEEQLAAFKYREPWELKITGDLTGELNQMVDQTIRARGTIIHEDDRRVFKILRYDKVEEVSGSIKNIEKDENGRISEATLEEKEGDRVFQINLNATAREFLKNVQVGAEIHAKGVIEGEGDSVTFDAMSFEKGAGEEMEKMPEDQHQEDMEKPSEDQNEWEDPLDPGNEEEDPGEPIDK